jgi:hypothetical protein
LADHQLLHFEDVLRSRKDVSIYHKLAIGINQLATSARNLAGNAEVGVERTVVVVGYSFLAAALGFIKRHFVFFIKAFLLN